MRKKNNKLNQRFVLNDELFISTPPFGFIHLIYVIIVRFQLGRLNLPRFIPEK